MGTNLNPRRQVAITLPEAHWQVLADEAANFGVTVGSYLRAIAMSHAQLIGMEGGKPKTGAREYALGWARGWAAKLDNISDASLNRLTRELQKMEAETGA